MTLRPKIPTLRHVAAIALALGTAPVLADHPEGDDRRVQARLSGFEEVPVVSTTGNGEFKARINQQTGDIDYEFSYTGMQGTVTQAHIHLAQSGVNGGIMVWLCQSITNPAPAAVAATTPVCSSPAFASSGVITTASVVGPGGAQQLGAGELDELRAALSAGVAYVNVHTNISPGGEIRGQIAPGHRH
jgi:CHRD domain